jgi:nitrile hydratase
MNGIHDMGGMHGFGRVEVEANEPVFHHRWEGRVFGMIRSLRGDNIDAGRHGIERLDPVTYLKNGYFGRWLGAFEAALARLGIVTADDIAARMKSRRRRRPRAKHAAKVSWSPSPGRSYARDVDHAPAFGEGQAVVTRDLQPEGHTRLPGYARRRRGVIVRVHPAMVFPDDNARNLGENPQYLYTVRFSGRELWGEGAEPGIAVHIDLFESYLETNATVP